MPKVNPSISDIEKALRIEPNDKRLEFIFDGVAEFLDSKVNADVPTALYQTAFLKAYRLSLRLS